MKSNFAIPCPMPLTVGGENPLPPAMIETLLKRRARSLCRVASLSIRESPRATFRGLFGVYLSRESADETHRTELSVWLSTRGQPLKRAQSCAVASTRTPSATMAAPKARSIQ